MLLAKLPQSLRLNDFPFGRYEAIHPWSVSNLLANNKENDDLHRAMIFCFTFTRRWTIRNNLRIFHEQDAFTLLEGPNHCILFPMVPHCVQLHSNTQNGGYRLDQAGRD